MAEGFPGKWPNERMMGLSGLVSSRVIRVGYLPVAGGQRRPPTCDPTGDYLSTKTTTQGGETDPLMASCGRTEVFPVCLVQASKHIRRAFAQIYQLPCVRRPNGWEMKGCWLCADPPINITWIPDSSSNPACRRMATRLWRMDSLRRLGGTRWLNDEVILVVPLLLGSWK